MIKKGTWVKIQDTILESGQRAPQLPEDTKKVPLIMWAKGYLQEDAEMNSVATVKTLTGRLVTGKVMEVEPSYKHDFGDFVPELLQIGKMGRKALWGGEDHE
ncbi:MAG: 2-amino-4-ketopentanoate thiolase [Tindallia sp. MSAO_Bac2]|nr:MAG: 2-amino-4-ketopentanoate thiolase [Tindallia sp. MSAO_Bac2]